MEGLSFFDLTLAKNGFLKPCWHTNAHKVGYCTQGRVLVSLHGSGLHERFEVGKGEIFHLPQGAIHHLENRTDNEAIIKFALNHASPQTMSLPQSLLATPIGAFNSTFRTDDTFLETLKAHSNTQMLGTLKQPSEPCQATVHRCKFDIENSDKAVEATGGYLQVGLKVNLDTLQGLGILGFGLNRGGAVEPHWHPNADELVYITRGRVQAMLCSPTGDFHVQELGEGEGFYAPESWLHSIEQCGNEEVEGIAFFNHPESLYVGLGEATGAFTDNILSSSFLKRWRTVILI